MPLILAAPVLYFLWSLSVFGRNELGNVPALDRVSARHEVRLYKNIEGLNVDARCNEGAPLQK
jgi:hypothetical protein